MPDFIQKLADKFERWKGCFKESHEKYGTFKDYNKAILEFAEFNIYSFVDLCAVSQELQKRGYPVAAKPCEPIDFYRQVMESVVERTIFHENYKMWSWLPSTEDLKKLRSGMSLEIKQQLWAQLEESITKSYNSVSKMASDALSRKNAGALTEEKFLGEAFAVALLMSGLYKSDKQRRKIYGIILGSKPPYVSITLQQAQSTIQQLITTIFVANQGKALFVSAEIPQILAGFLTEAEIKTSCQVNRAMAQISPFAFFHKHNAKDTTVITEESNGISQDNFSKLGQNY